MRSFFYIPQAENFKNDVEFDLLENYKNKGTTNGILVVVYIEHTHIL